MKDVFDILSQIDAPQVLDIATGHGEFVFILKEQLGSYQHISAVDSNAQNVNYAQSLFPDENIDIYRMNPEELAFGDSSFDMVTIFNSIHHILNWDRVGSEMLRVLKPGGILMVTEMYQDGQQSEAQRTYINVHHWIASVDRSLGIYHQPTFAKEQILALVEKLGLHRLQILDYYIPAGDPHQAEECRYMRQRCMDALKRMEYLDNADALRSEGENVLAKLETHGCVGARRLLLWGYKS